MPLVCCMSATRPHSHVACSSPKRHLHRCRLVAASAPLVTLQYLGPRFVANMRLLHRLDAVQSALASSPILAASVLPSGQISLMPQVSLARASTSEKPPNSVQSPTFPELWQPQSPNAAVWRQHRGFRPLGHNISCIIPLFARCIQRKMHTFSRKHCHYHTTIIVLPLRPHLACFRSQA